MVGGGFGGGVQQGGCVQRAQCGMQCMVCGAHCDVWRAARHVWCMVCTVPCVMCDVRCGARCAVRAVCYVLSDALRNVGLPDVWCDECG